MAEWDLKQLQRLRDGVETWNRWRSVHGSARPQLAGVDFAGVDLRHVDLSGAVLIGANFQQTDLRAASFRDALLLNADLGGAKLETADFRGASLREANFEGASLGRALLVGADLQGANLRNCELLWADLTGADLRNAKLDGAYLFEAKLNFAKLEGASLEKTDLREATFDGVDLSKVDLSSVDLGWIEPHDVEGIDRPHRTIRIEEPTVETVGMPDEPPYTDGSGSIPKGTRCASKREFAEVLRRWYEETDEPTIGDVGRFGGAAWLWVHAGGYECHLNADTKRSAVFSYLEWVRFRGPDYAWLVRANRKGTFNKVIVHPQGIETPGFYLYVKPALTSTAVL